MVASMAEEQELPSSVFVVEILVVILLSLAFETGQDKLRDYLKEHVRRENMMLAVSPPFPKEQHAHLLPPSVQPQANNWHILPTFVSKF